MVMLVFKNEIKKIEDWKFVILKILKKKKNNAWNSLPKVAFDSSKTNVEITFLGPSVEVNSVKNDVQL